MPLPRVKLKLPGSIEQPAPSQALPPPARGSSEQLGVQHGKSAPLRGALLIARSTLMPPPAASAQAPRLEPQASRLEAAECTAPKRQQAEVAGVERGELTSAGAKLAAPRGIRLPKLKLRDRGRLEGAELPLPPLTEPEEVRHTPSGYLVFGSDVVRVLAEREGPWGPLQPLIDCPSTQEVFVREVDGEAHITASIEGRRYIVELPRELLVERLAQRIAIEAGIPLSERNPQDSGEFRGWRVNLVLPQLAGGWQLSAARVVRAEPFKAEPLLLARLVALTASPSSVTFVGPPGSGKTTALIGVLSTLVSLWPKLRVSIVEEEPEVATQVRGPNVVSYFSFSDRNVTANIRATRRYDRPDVLVVGELRGEEVPSWFEAAGSGIPVLTTAHSRGLSDALKRLNTLIQAAGLQASVVDAVRVWVVCSKVVSSEGGIERGVQAVYVVDARGFVPAYKAGRHLPEEEFLKLLPPELQLSLEGVNEVEGLYELIKRRLNAPAQARFEEMNPLPFEEVVGS